MEDLALDKLRYPIGKFRFPENRTPEHLKEWIGILEDFPNELESLVSNLSAKQLDTPYRPGGWSIRQVVHHIADSHHHSYTRFKWSLTEHKPLIKAYEEKDWANLVDARTAPIELSLNYIKTLHAKLIFLLRKLSPEDLQRSYVHPDDHSTVTLEENIAKYAWHARHHYAHISGLIQRNHWK